jgi:hypothetical protein
MTMCKPCPCGSQLALENCCISDDFAALKNDYLNRMILPERIQWALDYLEYKTIHNHHILCEQARYAESIGEKITCQKKCSSCCMEFIAAKFQECDAIAVYLYLNPEVMNQFLWVRLFCNEP